MSDETNGVKFVDLPLMDAPDFDHLTTLINAGVDDEGNKVRCTISVPVPHTDDESKEFYGEGCTMDYIVRAGCRALATRPNFAAIAKKTLEGGGTFLDVQANMQEAMDSYEVNKPRPKKAKLDYDSAIALMAAENGLSVDAIRKAIGEAKENGE